MQRQFMKHETANSLGNFLLGGTVITTGAAASVESLSWIQANYSEIMVFFAFAGLVSGIYFKYLDIKLKRKIAKKGK